MPCLEEKDLTHLIDQHVAAQKAICTEMRQRLSEMQSQFKKTGDPKFSAAVADLEFHLNGNEESPSGGGKFVKIPNQKTAEERIAVMEAQYRQSPQFEFHDTTKNTGKPRTASVFGMPSAEQMRKLGHDDIADDIDTRALSLAQASATSRNPVHYLDDSGLTVKTPLGNGIEHHHIFNNVHLSEKGRVEFKSYDIYYNHRTKQMEFSAIPSHWNAEEHGRNTQFIGLLDGMHSGADPATHLHFYKFTNTEKQPILDKIRADHPAKAASAAARIPKLQDELRSLRSRQVNPVKYEDSLKSQLATATKERDTKKSEIQSLSRITDKNYPDPKDKAAATTKRKGLEDELKLLEKPVKAISGKLTEHQTIQTLKRDIADNYVKIADLDSKIKAIGNLGSYAVGTVRDAKKTERQQHLNGQLLIKETIKNQNVLLKNKGDLSVLVNDIQRKIIANSRVSRMSTDDAIKMFENTNGFFNFDKGREESDLHTQYRPIMNEEITRHQARAAIAHLETEYGSNALAVAQTKVRNQYKRNLLLRLQALQIKLL